MEHPAPNTSKNPLEPKRPAALISVPIPPLAPGTMYRLADEPIFASAELTTGGGWVNYSLHAAPVVPSTSTSFPADPPDIFVNFDIQIARTSRVPSDSLAEAMALSRSISRSWAQISRASMEWDREIVLDLLA